MKPLLLICLFFLAIPGRADSFQIYEENGKVGIKNQEGKVVLPASFEALGWSDGSFSVIGNVTGYRQNNQWGIINLKKEFITKADFESLVYASGDYVLVKKKITPAQYKTGCLNLRGEVQIPFVYDDIQLHGLRAIVINLYNGKYRYGLADLHNNVLIPVTYARIYPLGTLRFGVQNEAGKIALFSEDGRAISKFDIDSIASFQNSKAVFYKNLNKGLLDREGNVVADARYRDIRIEDDCIYILPHNQWLVLNTNNQTVQTISAEDIQPSGNQKNIYRYTGLSGLMDNQWNVILPAQYQYLQHLQDDFYVGQKNGKTGVINTQNEIQIPFRYDSIAVDKGFVRALTNSGWQLTDLKQSFRSYKNYACMGQQFAGLFPVLSNGYWGALNTVGDEAIHCVFDSLIEISKKYLVVKFKGQYGIISHREEWLVAPQAHPLKLVNDSCYLQLQPHNKFLKTFKGAIVYFTDNPVTFDQNFWTEYLPDGTIKTLDYDGRIIARKEPPQVDKVEEVYEEHEGLRGIKRDGKYGFIDVRGRLRIANRYDGIGYFSESMAAIKLMGRWGFVNSQDQIVINPNYNEASPFKNGLSVVNRNGKTGIIDKQGKPVLKLEYDSIQKESETLFRLYKNKLVGLANSEGRILIDPRFNELQILPNGMVLVSHGEKHGVISADGMSVIPLIYDALYFHTDKNQYLALQKAEWKPLFSK